MVGQKNKNTIIVLTSGGDAPGMNPALRAVVRCWISGDNDHVVLAAKNGYTGILKEDFIQLDRKKVGGLISRGGTVLGAGRCEEIKIKNSPERKKIHRYLKSISDDLAGVIVIGGNGSFAGMKSLLDTQCKVHAVGIPATIDNDVWGTDLSLGVDTALNTVVEIIDKIRDTAAAFQRAFIIEIMGRECGYLALVTAIASEAEAVFLPESQPNFDDLGDMNKNLDQLWEIEAGKAVVILAEGSGLKLSTLQNMFETYTKWDFRSVVPGYAQRGGSPSAIDRILGCRFGCKAIEAIESSNQTKEAKMVALQGNQIEIRNDLKTILKNSGKNARTNDDCFNTMVKLQKDLTSYQGPLGAMSNVGGAMFVIHGKDAPGINAAIRSFTRLAMKATCPDGWHGFRTIAVRNGFKELISDELDIGNYIEMTWRKTIGLTYSGGIPSQLAQINIKPIFASPRDWMKSQRIPTLIKKIENNFQEYLRIMAESGNSYNINCLVLVGGRDAIYSIRDLRDAGFSLPIIFIPASIDNDIPLTEYSIGFDTAVNNAIKAIDKIKETALAEGRVFLIETMGGGSGFLPLSIGLASGAEHIFIPEFFKKTPSKKDMLEVVDFINRRFKTSKGKPRRTHAILVFHEAVIEALGGIDAVADIFRGKINGNPPPFEVRKTVLGYSQRGGTPSAYDRVLATCLGAAAAEGLCKLTDNSNGYAVVLQGGKVEQIPLSEYLIEAFKRDDEKFDRMKELCNTHIKLARDEWLKNRINLLDTFSYGDFPYNYKEPLIDIWKKHWK